MELQQDSTRTALQYCKNHHCQSVDVNKGIRMKQILFSVGFCLISSFTFAGEKVDQTLKADNNGYVQIEHLGGYANIKGWSKNEVRVVGELGDRTEKFIFERDGNEVIIKVKVKNNKGTWSWGSEDGDDLEIYVPLDSHINYNSTNANVEVTQVRGSADIDTVNGNIEVTNLSGRLRIEAVNGDVTARSLQGNINIQTVNGDIKDSDSTASEAAYESVNGDIDVVVSSPEVKAETVNGDIELTLGKVEHLNLNTVNGSVQASMALASQGDVRATSVGGGISLYFQPDVSARFDLQGHAGGRIINKITQDKEHKAKYGPSRWLEFSHNGGNGQVKVSTVSGRIKVDKK
ncbi:DUF4097 family beta strand repeat-containing protein [Aliiglaciecola sp. 2_MG-2023]|uniref:DUF4097 family beta strand repeat-containing protein n=1 Tax=unclassified Aliiglaciecola TaxID=2593648 RepID=UPI0026E16ACB|nr:MULTISPECIES: DUF4097 family beta strand repeat-containing protein [unclassified Aliiglaciecola]MDO6713074.1 DUF4097 family beta strand repeat-containing protein [Aliiglaciecola sp. 2_MG-2023]MDO6754160.1 DUF4097 family beta strand repeat-containing protein [Aliiglaciecola sp. 1_MG-2023]